MRNLFVSLASYKQLNLRALHINEFWSIFFLIIVLFFFCRFFLFVDSNITPNLCFLLLSLEICDEELELGRCWRKDTDLQLGDE